MLTELIDGHASLDSIGAADVRRWAVRTTRYDKAPSNNNVRTRLSSARSFLSWALYNDLVDYDVTDDLGGMRKQYPRLYGKVQAPRPARWLTRDQAFGALIDACQDGTWIGSRDQLVVRLGLLGLRVHEIAKLTWGDWTGTTFDFIGKGNRPRTVTAGPNLAALVPRWRRCYEHNLGRPLAPSDPFIPNTTPAAGRSRAVLWGHRLTPDAVSKIVTRRGCAAGLGDIAGHDLRRTAAGLLHQAVTDDGAHHFDLLDVQRVLDHADPATTMRSYLDHLNTGSVKARAGQTLD
jgi:integrase